MDNNLADRAESGEDAAVLLRELQLQCNHPVAMNDFNALLNINTPEAHLAAAMMLVPQNTFYHISQFSEDGGSGAEAHIYPNRHVGDDYTGNGPTPAHALIAAIARSQADGR